MTVERTRYPQKYGELIERLPRGYRSLVAAFATNLTDLGFREESFIHATQLNLATTQGEHVIGLELTMDKDGNPFRISSQAALPARSKFHPVPFFSVVLDSQGNVEEVSDSLDHPGVVFTWGRNGLTVEVQPQQQVVKTSVPDAPPTLDELTERALKLINRSVAQLRGRII